MTAVSKNAYGDKLPELFDNYNNTNHSSIKIKCAYANPDFEDFTLMLRIIKKLKSILMITKVIHQIGAKKFL